MEKEKPVHEVELPFAGSLLKASIWREKSYDQYPRYSVSLTRLNRGIDGKWTANANFGRDDLLGVSRLAEVAHGWIVTTTRRGGEGNE